MRRLLATALAISLGVAAVAGVSAPNAAAATSSAPQILPQFGAAAARDLPITFAEASETPLVRANLGGDPATGVLDAHDVVVGDLNADQSPDLIASVDRSITGRNGTIAVMLGNGDGTFADPVETLLPGLTRHTPRALALGDFDGDSDLDVVAGVPTRREVDFFENDGTGHLAAPVFSPTVDRVSDLVTADLDRDGDLDLASVNPLDDTAAVYFGHGDGTFGAAVTLTGVGDNPQAIAVGQFDGMRGLDVAVGAYGAPYAITIHLDAGARTFAAPLDNRVVPAGGRTYHLWAAALDGDAATDLAVFTEDGNQVAHLNHSVITLHGNGNGTFTIPPTATWPVAVDPGYAADASEHYGYTDAPSDIDGDGDLDLAAVNAYSGNAYFTLARNDGAGNFALTQWSYLQGIDGSALPARNANACTPCSTRPGVVARFADIDRDGAGDVVVAGRHFYNATNDGGVSVVRGDSDRPGRMRTAEVLAATGGLIDTRNDNLRLVDWTGDGNRDLVYGEYTGSSGIRVHPGRGDLTFGTPFTITSPNVARCASERDLVDGDFDGDGNLDLWCRSTTYNAPSVMLYGDGAGGVAADVVIEHPAGTALYGTRAGAAVGDFDGDGDLDVADPRQRADQSAGVFVSFNNGVSRTWSSGPVLDGGRFGTFALTAADLDHDGDDDMVGWTDRARVAAGIAEDRLVVFESDGNGTFAAPVDRATGAPIGPSWLEAADLDGDEFPELVGAFQPDFPGTRGALWVLPGDGDTTFGTPVKYPASPYGYDFELRDLDGDDHLDAVIASFQMGAEVLRGTPDGGFEAPLRFPAGGYQTWSIDAADLDGDDQPEIAVARCCGGSAGDRVAILPNTTGSTSTEPPDLTVSSTSTPAAPLTPGDTGHFEFTVRNDGGAATGSWRDQLWLSTDGAWDLGDRLLAERVRNGLGAGASYTVAIDPRLAPLRSGTHRVIVRTDVSNQLAEVDESDNSALAPTVLDLGVPQLALGAPATITVGDDMVRYRRVAVTAGQRLLLEVDGPTDAADIDAVRNAVPVPIRDLVVADPARAHRTLVLPPGAAGEWWFRIEGRAGAGAGSALTLRVSQLDTGLVDVMPKFGSNAGSTTLTLHGVGLPSGATVELRQGALHRAATAVTPVDTMTLFAEFDLTGLDPGNYDVALMAGAATYTLPAAFEVVATPRGEFTFYAQVPDRLRAQFPTQFPITWQNTGSVDLVAPFLKVRCSGCDLRAVPTDDFTTAIDLHPQVDGGPPGVLPASAVGRLQPEIRALTASFTVVVESYEADDRTPSDWTEEIAAFRPQGLSNAAWALVAARLTTELGSTTGAYVRALGAGALDAARYGVELRSEAARLRYLVDRAVATTPGALLRVCVVDDATGDVVPRATVSARVESGSAAPTARTWYDGCAGLWGAGRGHNLVTVDGSAPTPAGEIEIGTDPVDLEVRVRAGAVLFGNVDRADGSDAPGARVLVRTPTGTTIVVSADASGAYLVPGLDDGIHTVEALDDGGATGSAPTDPMPFEIVGGAGAARNLVLGATGAVSGRVVAAGNTAVAGAAVTVSGALGVVRSTRSSADGTFSVAGIPTGDARVDVLAPAGVATKSGTVAAPTVLDLGTLRVGPTGSVEVTVVDPDDAPITDATVFAGSGADATRTTNRYRLDGLAAGTQMVAVHHPGYASTFAEVAVVAGATATKTVHLAPVRSVHGRVVDGAGHPVVDVSVRLVEGAAAAGGPMVTDTHVTTDDGGRFEFDFVATGNHLVEVEGGTARAVVSVSNAAPDVEVELVLEAATITGQVTGTGGVGVFNSPVSVTGPTGTLVTHTDRDGHFRLMVNEAGSYTVIATGDSGGFARATAVATLGETVDVGALYRAPGNTLRVRVLGGGVAIAGALVDVTPAELTDGEGLLAATDATGWADYPGAAAGAYVVTASEPGRARARTVIVAEDGVTQTTVNLAAGRTVRGRVLFGASPVAGALVALGDTAERPAGLAITDAAGTFAVDELASGTYTLVVRDDVHQSEVRSVIVAATDVDLGDVALTAAAIPPAAPGSPAARADSSFVFVKVADPFPPGGAAPPASTGAQVVFMKDGVEVAADRVTASALPGDPLGYAGASLPPGEYQVEVRQPGREPSRQRITVGPGGGEFEVEMGPTSSVPPNEPDPAATAFERATDAEIETFVKAWLGDSVQFAWPITGTLGTTWAPFMFPDGGALSSFRTRFTSLDGPQCPDVSDEFGAVQKLFDLMKDTHTRGQMARNRLEAERLTIVAQLIPQVRKLQDALETVNGALDSIDDKAIEHFVQQYKGDEPAEPFSLFPDSPEFQAETARYEADVKEYRERSAKANGIVQFSRIMGKYVNQYNQDLLDGDISGANTQLLLMNDALSDSSDLLESLTSDAKMFPVAADLWKVKGAIGQAAQLHAQLSEVFDSFMQKLEEIKFYKARYERYVWDYDRAFRAYLRAVEDQCRCPDGTMKTMANPECPDEDDDDEPPPTDDQEGHGIISAPKDPNDLLGPVGSGTARWIPETIRPNYKILFENIGPGSKNPPPGVDPATAPAVIVDVTTTLDADLDPATFALGPFGFGATNTMGYPAATFTPAAGATAFYEARVSLVPRYEATGTAPIVLVGEASFDVDARVARWRITALDPVTGAPPGDARIGFLPPEDGSGAGGGFAHYDVALRSGLVTGTTIDAKARVVFDENAAIDTPEWRNTIDADPPKPKLTALKSASPQVFTVAWNPGEVGSGVGGVDVWYSLDGGPLRAWLTGTTKSSAKFAGVVGHRYGFAVRATDNVGHDSARPTRAATTTRVVQPDTAPQGARRRAGVVALAGNGAVVVGPGASAHGSLSGAGLSAAPVDIARTASGRGYLVALADGSVIGFGDAHVYGSLVGRTTSSVVSIMMQPDSRGYWLVTANGKVFGFGRARSLGSLTKVPASPVVEAAMSPTGRGYLLVTAKGRVSAFGDLRVRGSISGPTPSPVVDVAITPTGRGYFLVTAKGKVHAFGDARHRGNPGNGRLVVPVAGITATSAGYAVVGGDGATYEYGNAAAMRNLSVGGRKLLAAAY